MIGAGAQNLSAWTANSSTTPLQPAPGPARRSSGGPVDQSELKVTRYETAGAVATITLDRPQRLNAWTGRMNTEYRSLLARAAADGSVRVIVVTGAGRGFCAGADTRALEGHVDKGGYDAGTGPDLA